MDLPPNVKDLADPFFSSALNRFLAHLWGAYAISLALSIVRRVSSVSTITTRNNEAIKSIFSANVYHVSGLCLLGIGGAPKSVIKLWLENHIFTFSTSSLKQPAVGISYYARTLLNLGHDSLFKLW